MNTYLMYRLLSDYKCSSFAYDRSFERVYQCLKDRSNFIIHGSDIKLVYSREKHSIIEYYSQQCSIILDSQLLDPNGKLICIFALTRLMLMDLSKSHDYSTAKLIGLEFSNIVSPLCQYQRSTIGGISIVSVLAAVTVILALMMKYR